MFWMLIGTKLTAIGVAAFPFLALDNLNILQRYFNIGKIVRVVDPRKFTILLLPQENLQFYSYPKKICIFDLSKSARF